MMVKTYRLTWYYTTGSGRAHYGHTNVTAEDKESAFLAFHMMACKSSQVQFSIIASSVL